MRIEGKDVFLSGPMSGIDHYNAAAFAEAHAICKEAGAHRAFNPAIEWLCESGEANDHAYYMRKCINELVITLGIEPYYDVLVSLPGWQESEGARLERDVAVACGIAVCELSEVER